MRCVGIALSLLALSSGCGTDEAVSATGDLPSQPVEVSLDDNGVPHIYGATDRDAFYGAGYMIASHRLLQIEMARRRAFGRLGEVFGNERLEDDQLARLFDWKGAGRRSAERTRLDNPEEWSLMQAWVAGLDRRIDEVLSGEAPLPYGFSDLGLVPERWNDEDVLIMAKMVGFGNDLSLDFEIFVSLAERLLPDLIPKIPLSMPAHPVFTVPPEDLPQIAKSQRVIHGAHASTTLAPVLHTSRLWKSLASLRVGGSNNFAIDGLFTDSGRPMLAGDPHLSFDFPGLFYALHINSKDQGGSFDAAGFSFPFLPGVSIGQTDSLAWSPTTAFADVMDIWEVPTPDEATALIGGKSVPLVTHEETIILRTDGDPVGSGNEVSYEVRTAPGYGVMLPNDIAPLSVAKPGNALLLAWTGFDVTGPSRLTSLNRTQHLDDFDQVVDQQTALNFNMLAADAQGITYRVGVDVPVRDAAAHSPWKVMDGSDPSALWNGEILPREYLPHGRAKERGWIATANNDPFGFTQNGRFDDDPWYYGAFFDPGWRANRLHTELGRLADQGGVSVADMQALQLDVHDNLADDVLPLLDEAWAHTEGDPALAAYRADPRLTTLMQALDDWDRKLVRSSSGAVVFTAFAHFLSESTLADDLGLLYQPILDLEKIYIFKFALQALRGDFPAAADLVLGGRDHLLLEALERTATEFLEPRFGGVDPSLYEYGDLHVTKFDDALGLGVSWGEAATDGGECTVNVSPHSWLDGDSLSQRWTSQMGPILRLVVSFDAGGRPHMLFNFPLGNIADPSSSHSSDLTTAWTDGTYRTMYFSRDEVDAHTEAQIEIR